MIVICLGVVERVLVVIWVVVVPRLAGSSGSWVSMPSVINVGC